MRGRHEHEHHDHHDHDHDHGERVDGMPRGRRRAFDEGGWGRWGGGGPGFGPGRGRGRGRGRARKGDVKAAVLALLAERPMHGYEIIGELAERTGGMWKPSPGSVYPTLQLLEEEGLVVGEELEGKRRFSLTDEGRAKVAEQPDTAPWEEVARGADPDVVELWNAFKQMAMAVRQISVAAAPEQQRKALAVLTEARKKLYGILAED
ncbi:MAG TPA: PadR family transcriptional regulator [Acidimicrobiales bacterium]